MFVHSISLLGKRESNEDQHDDFNNFTKKDKAFKDLCFLGIYDGHGGKDVSKFLKMNMTQYFIPTTITYNPTDKNYSKYIFKVFQHLQNKLKNEYRNNAAHTGSTALISIIYQFNNKYHCFIANVGDSRAIICNGNNIAVPLTKDHKPTSFEEKNRIEQLGGVIKFEAGDWRIKDLSVSKSFGDLDAYPFVIAEPDIYKYEINKRDKFIVMACDGLWDVLSNQDVVDFVLFKLKEIKENKDQMNTNNKSNIAKSLGEYAIEKGSYDNISIVIAFL